MDEEREKAAKVKKKKRSVLIAILIFAVLCVAGGLIWWLNRPADDYLFDKQARDGLIDAHTKEDVQKILDTVVSKGMFNASINPNPVFSDGNAEGDLWIENIQANHYYTTVTIIRNDNGETIFSSKGIKPNQNIEKAKLDKALPKGEYPCTAVFRITDPETMKEIGLVNIQLTITVQN